MLKFIENWKQKREAKAKLGEEIEKLALAELDRANESDDPEETKARIENAKILADMLEDRERNKLTKEKNLIDKIGIAASLINTSANIGAQVMAINHADALSRDGYIDNTGYGQVIKKNLFLPKNK